MYNSWALTHGSSQRHHWPYNTVGRTYGLSMGGLAVTDDCCRPLTQHQAPQPRNGIACRHVVRGAKGQPIQPMRATISATISGNSSHNVQCLQSNVRPSHAAPVCVCSTKSCEAARREESNHCRRCTCRLRIRIEQHWSIQVAQDLGACVGLRQLRKGVPVLALHQPTQHV